MGHFTTHGGVLECSPRCYRYSNKDGTFLVRLSSRYSFQWVERKLLQIYKVTLLLFNVALFCSVLEVNMHWRPVGLHQNGILFVCLYVANQTTCNFTINNKLNIKWYDKDFQELLWKRYCRIAWVLSSLQALSFHLSLKYLRHYSAERKY